METRLRKRAGKAVWTLESEWEDERLSITRSGQARLCRRNGGWNGAYDVRTYQQQRPTVMSLAEAVAILESWGVDEDDLTRVRALRPYLAADFE